MGNSESQTVSATTTTPAKQPELGPDGKPKCKACCACPETKRARDACVLENGEENCGELIEKHKQCMRDMGFKI